MKNNIQKKKITDSDQGTQLSNIKTQNFKSNLVKISDGLFSCKLLLVDGKYIDFHLQQDGYVNVTLLCKAAGKDINKWKENKSSKELISSFSSLTGILVSKILKINRVEKTQYTFAHPDIAIQIAQWCHSSFAMQVSRYIRELLLFGSVTLGQEKPTQELEHKFQEQIQTLQGQLTKSEDEKLQIMQKYNFKLQKHKYHKFKKQYLKICI